MSPHPEGRKPNVCLATAVQQLILTRRVGCNLARRVVKLEQDGSGRRLRPLSHQQRDCQCGNTVRASASFNVLTTVIHGGPLESRMSRWRIAVAICSLRSGTASNHWAW